MSQPAPLLFAPPMAVLPGVARARRVATRPTPELCVLGSGSGGNSTALRVDAGVVLIDAGFSPARPPPGWPRPARTSAK